MRALTLLSSFFFVLIFISSCSGGEMKDYRLTQLGTVQAGEIKSGRMKTETNDTTPIVLWSKNGPPTVLYYNHTEENEDTRFTQKIAKLTESEPSFLTKWHSSSKGYPIIVKDSMKHPGSEQGMDLIDPAHLITGDINGDGNDELIFTRQYSGIYVYGANGLLQKGLPNHSPAAFSYEVQQVHKASLKNKDVIFYLTRRDLHEPDDDEPSAADTKYHNEHPRYTIARVDASGIADVRLKGMPWQYSKILAVGALNPPGSEEIEEIVIVGKKDDTEEIYVSRHRYSGDLIEPPRKMYFNQSKLETLEFRFVPQSNEMVGIDGGNLWFIEPTKKVNWCRCLDMTRLFGDKNHVSLVGTLKPKDTAALALINYRHGIYAVGGDKKFYVSKNGSFRAAEGILALKRYEDGVNHFSTEVMQPKAGSDNLVVVNTRPTQLKPLSDEDIIHAGEQYLSDHVLSECKESLKIRAKYIEARAETFCRANSVYCPAIKSIEDAEKYLPQLYSELIEEARRDYVLSLRYDLFLPVKNKTIDSASFNPHGYKNVEEYKSWLKSLRVPASTIVAHTSLSESKERKATISDFVSLRRTSELEWLQAPWVNQAGAMIVLVMQKTSIREAEVPSYFLMTW